MTVPRHEIYEPSEVGVYHCISRCVRRAFLCGKDHYSGKDYEHRRVWMRERLGFLAEVFSIEVVAYAIMTNHLHTLIKTRPDKAAEWSAEEVARRWRKLFPLRREKNGKTAEPNADEIRFITCSSTLVEKYRERLCNISWFNRCLCENIARRANREDECKGRFWEGRFKSQGVESIGALIACGVYIDLNPIRAGMANTPEESDYTSIQDRIRGGKHIPLISIEEVTKGSITTSEYLSLVDNTGRNLANGKRGRISPKLADILTRLKLNPLKWDDTTENYRVRFKRVIAPLDLLLEAASKANKRWLHGTKASARAFIS